MKDVIILIVLFLYVLIIYRQTKVDIFRHKLREQKKEEILKKYLSREMILKFWKPLKEEVWK